MPDEPAVVEANHGVDRPNRGSSRIEGIQPLHHGRFEWGRDRKSAQRQRTRKAPKIVDVLGQQRQITRIEIGQAAKGGVVHPHTARMGNGVAQHPEKPRVGMQRVRRIPVAQQPHVDLPRRHDLVAGQRAITPNRAERLVGDPTRNTQSPHRDSHGRQRGLFANVAHDRHIGDPMGGKCKLKRIGPKHLRMTGQRKQRGDGRSRAGKLVYAAHDSGFTEHEFDFRDQFEIDPRRPCRNRHLQPFSAHRLVGGKLPAFGNVPARGDGGPRGFREHGRPILIEIDPVHQVQPDFEHIDKIGASPLLGRHFVHRWPRHHAHNHGLPPLAGFALWASRMMRMLKCC